MTGVPVWTQRITQLDGLRGLAALVVVIHHLMLTIPAMAIGYQDPTKVDAALGWLVFSPLHILWNGSAAVDVFFVLSGFVLILPLTRRRPDWRSYYPKRLLRLYLPVWGSVILAALLVLLIHRSSGDGQSWWTNSQLMSLHPDDLVSNALLLAGATSLNSPLWSLQWEIWFSLLLPLFFLLARTWSRGWWIKLAALAVLSTVGSIVHMDALFYLPIFGFGAVLAVEGDRLRTITASWGTGHWGLAFVVSLLMLNAAWDVRAYIPGNGEIVALGALLLVAIFICARGAARVGDSRIAQWLGRISFSLYLVHVPVLLSLTFLIRDPGISVPVALVVCVACAQLFYWAVERPAHRLAQAVGRYFARPRPIQSERTAA